jgi:cytochrome c oxidase assembly factor CtaG
MAAVGLTLVLLSIGVVYLYGWLRHLPVRSIPIWRACSFFLGLSATWVAVASPVASLDSHMLTAHMIQHLLLMTIAPPLIWLGEPLLTLRSGPRQARSAAGGLGKLPGDPVFCWLSAAAALVVWHVPAVFRLGMQSPAWHFIEHASFLATGLLFWWPVIQPWPSVARWPQWSMLLYLFLATLPCDVLSGLLVFSDRVAYPMYASMPQMGGLSALEDQQCAAALMWTCVTVVFLLAGTILSMHILSPKHGLEEAVSV